MAEPRLKPALIFHEGERRFIADPVRDSDAAGFPLVFEWPTIHALNRRFAAVSGTDITSGETLQVLRYRPGQQYRAHLDAIPGMANQRHLTLLTWLNDAYEGGETLFTELCIAERGRTGDALLFANALPDGRPDPATRHVGSPVTSGIKLLASRWIRQRPPDDPLIGFGQHDAPRA
jgi:prolyl 4-hydroxylase